jgi:hypothetical protein
MRIGSMLNPQAGGLPSSAAGPGTGFSPLGTLSSMTVTNSCFRKMNKLKVLTSMALLMMDDEGGVIVD